MLTSYFANRLYIKDGPSQHDVTKWSIRLIVKPIVFEAEAQTRPDAPCWLLERLQIMGLRCMPQ